MIEFYTWIFPVRLLITVLFAFCVTAQTISIFLNYFRHPRNLSRFFENLLELVILGQILLCSLMHGQTEYGYEMSLIPSAGYTGLRVICFILIFLLAGIVIVQSRKPRSLLVIAASCLTLPAVEKITGQTEIKIFAYLFITASLFWFVRSVYSCILLYREISTSISAFSIKSAIDSLHTGIIFGEPDGFILLSNAQMRRLMKIISGRVYRNGNYFYGLLSSEKIEPGCRKTEFENQIVCLLPDGSAWMFSRTELIIGKKEYIQLTATDITERWKLTEQLQIQNNRLNQRSAELKETIANLYILSRERETQKAKIRAHDVLSKRLTLLLRTVRSEHTLDYGLLRSMSQGLIDELKTGESELSPEDELDGLRQVFGTIGVEIQIDGNLPEDSIKGRLFADIIKEAVTNAVRHGFATKIYVNLDCQEGACRLKITDNGKTNPGEIVEGGGIGGMRMKILPHNGELNVVSYPDFILSVDLLGGA